MPIFNLVKKFKRNAQEGISFILRESKLYFSFSFKKRWLALSNEKLKIYFDKYSNKYSAEFFDENKASLYWKGQELSKGLGLHMALKVNDNWYDSSCADWRIKRLSQDKLHINIIYRDIPVEESWILSLTGENELSWDMEMLVKEQVEIRQKKIGLFVVDKYLHWFNAAEEGEFPEGFNWENICLNQIDSRIFGVKPEEGYPGILLEVDAEGLPLLQNSHEELKCRAMQFELADDKENGNYPAGSYKLGSGKIKVIEQESVINNYIENCKPLSLDNESFYIFGDSKELHNKIAGNANDFQEKVARINQVLKKNSKINIKIGVSRHNFFRLKEMVEYTFSLLGKKIDLGPIGLDLFPVQKLYNNFINYLENIKSKIEDLEVKLVLMDEGLFDLLSTVSNKANPHNEKKLLRLLSVIIEHTFLGPQIVVIDPYHRCNVNCLHCWVHTPKIKHTAEFLNRKLDFDTYKRMIDDFAELKVDNIIFQGDGEPLLHDRFLEMVRYARGKKIDISFFTNGLLLNKDISQESVALGVSQIFCSLPAGTDKTYCLVTHRQDVAALSKVLDNLKYLTSVKRQANKIYPKLIMTHVIHTLNYQEIMQMAQNDVAVGADVMRFYLIRLDDNIKFLQLKPEEIECIRESMSEVKAYLKDKHVELLDTTDFQLDHYEKDTGAWSKGVFLKEGCPLGWFFSLVPALGDLSLCCHLRTVGYLKEKSFKEIWTSREYEKYRVQAKYLKDNQEATFLNGVKLYDQHCEHCDTHQVIRDIWEEMKNYNLERFVFK